MKSVAQGQQKDREVNNAIIECYNDKLLMKWFLKLRKASKILKKRKNNEKTIIKKKKQLYFDKWVIELQNYRLHLQLLQDSTIYYNEVLIKKAFKGWKRHMLDSKKYQTQLEQVCKIFKNWRNYTKEQNNKRNSKYQPIHNKWRKQTFFNYWKDATLDSQKDKLAKGFYMYKIFQSWKQYIEEIKQIQLKLQDKELILTVQIEKKRKKRYLLFWRRAYESKIEKKGLNKVMLQAKLKQRKLELLIQGFRSFKNNWKLNKYSQYKRIKFIQMIFYSIKYFTDLSKMKMEQLINYQNKKRLQQLSKVFKSLKYDYDLIKQKDEKAQSYYNKRLQRDYFQLFIKGVIKQYQRELKLSSQFYIQRRIIYTFGALKSHWESQRRRKINKKKLEKYLGSKQFKLLKQSFKKMRAHLLSQRKGKKKLLQLEFNVFYQWRLQTKLKMLKKQY
ncbi:unnamed protein product (macronuclear) [Paramecium tetraurelia]|uniref:Sfi1 spindle body domain-containing protein n=1 Tax=Paramecium tetraurelia TaxID=5888 RepID=A0D748_PARTE|nr:uncharacterized protein GSPATT00001906001 [Paramecium tetraurelia]CAK78865.1 unnamed protein product [Paramecium tetraurelia]|eukprot:XP_001446262.1 hypothetical protein (macronuclear) [Paramecium tetraurelia strain d4-2]